VSNAIAAYLRQTAPEAIHPGMLGYVANLSQVATVSPVVAKSIVQELADQRSYLKLIASENYCSLATQLAMGNLLTDKYAEGFAGQRFYEGCDNVDTVESYRLRTGQASSSARSTPTSSRTVVPTPT
jgi:glycine hydroxymethyltransferase